MRKCRSRSSRHLTSFILGGAIIPLPVSSHLLFSGSLISKPCSTLHLILFFFLKEIHDSIFLIFVYEVLSIAPHCARQKAHFSRDPTPDSHFLMWYGVGKGILNRVWMVAFKLRWQESLN